MLDDLVISGLTKRRAAVSGEIAHIQKQLAQNLLDLKTIDAAIKLFDADYPIESIAPKVLYPNSMWTTRGEMTRLIFDILRQSSAPKTAREIVDQILTLKNIDNSRPQIIVSMRKNVLDALNKKHINGQVHRYKEPGQHLTWAIVMPPSAASTLSSSGSPDA